MKKAVIVLLLVGSLCLLGFGGCQLYQYWGEGQQSNEIYSSLEEYIQMPDNPISSNPQPSPDSQEVPASSSTLEVDFESLQQVNPDIVGWLYCEDTVINYPVVQGEDNSYYLKHLFDGAYNANGCLFLDSRVNSDFSGNHSIIYGHHMRNGTMFSSLDGYKEQSYYDKHPTLLLITPSQNYVMIIFAGYVASVEDSAWDVSFSNEIEFENWINSAIERSCFESNIHPSAEDRILTLSTCSYEFDDARFVLLGTLEAADTN